MLDLKLRGFAVAAASAVALLGGGAASASTVIQGFSDYNGGDKSVEADGFLYTPTAINNGQCAPDDANCLNEDNGNGGGGGGSGASEAGLVTNIYETDGTGEENIVNNGFSYMGQYLNFNGAPPSAGNFYQVTGFDWQDTGGGVFDYVAGQVVNFDTTRSYAQYKSTYTGLRIYFETGSELADADKLTFQSGGFFITYGALFSNVDRITLFGQATGGQSRSDCLATAHDTGVSFGTITDFDGCTPTIDDGGNPEVVPLPAAGWMLIAGVGGLLAMKRRRKAA